MDLIDRHDAIDELMEILDRPNHAEFLYTDEICKALNELPSVQPDVPDTNVGDLISRQVAIDICHKNYDGILDFRSDGRTVALSFEDIINSVPSAQPEPISDVYMKAVWTWLLDYQIKAAELKGRYTPYEVLSWVANDWRKEHEGSD